jgi:hypothetical protein
MIIFGQPIVNLMKHILLILCVAFLPCTMIFGQAKTRKLSSSINHPSINLHAPFISADANAMVFISDNAEDAVLTPFYTVREPTDWKEPEMLPKNIHTRLNFLRGYSLSGDGKRIYFSTIKGPGVGGFDLWYSDWKGSGWGEPVNPGQPINTKGNEGCASISTDGNTMYFMRCEKMDANSSSNCKIFKVTKKLTGQWEEPTELPANINTGNSQTPRIMADDETLIFSSDKLSGKGGMDLFVTKFQNNKWSDPKPMNFINSEKDDQYVSVTALGRYVLKDTQGPKKNELVEYLIPAELRPKGMMKIEGKVTDPSGQPIQAYLAAFELASGQRVYNARPNSDGSFFLYLKEGSQYEFAIDPEQNNVSYYSKIFDLTDKVPQIEKISAVLKPMTAGDELPIERVAFKPYSAQLDVASSSGELKRLIRVINGNPTLTFQIQVLMEGYAEDSLQSNPDMTEVVYDTVVYEFNGVDSLGQDLIEDSLAVEATYHNNRTVAQAQAVVDYLVSQGVSPERLLIYGNAIPAVLPDNKKLTIKAVAGQ